MDVISTAQTVSQTSSWLSDKGISDGSLGQERLQGSGNRADRLAVVRHEKSDLHTKLRDTLRWIEDARDEASTLRSSSTELVILREELAAKQRLLSSTEANAMEQWERWHSRLEHLQQSLVSAEEREHIADVERRAAVSSEAAMVRKMSSENQSYEHSAKLQIDQLQREVERLRSEQQDGARALHHSEQIHSELSIAARDVQTFQLSVESKHRMMLVEEAAAADARVAEAAQSREIALLTAQLARCESSTASVSEEHKALRHSVQDKEKQLGELKLRVHQTGAEHASAVEEMRSLSGVLESRRIEHQNVLRAVAQESASRERALQLRVRTLEQEAGRSQAEVETLRGQTSSISRRWQLAEHEAQHDLQRSEEDAARRQATFRRRVVDLEAGVQQYESEQIRAERRVQAVQLELKQAEMRLREELQTESSSAEGLARRLQGARQENAQLRAEMQDVENALQRAEGLARSQRDAAHRVESAAIRDEQMSSERLESTIASLETLRAKHAAAVQALQDAHEADSTRRREEWHVESERLISMREQNHACAVRDLESYAAELRKTHQSHIERMKEEFEDKLSAQVTALHAQHESSRAAFELRLVTDRDELAARVSSLELMHSAAQQQIVVESQVEERARAEMERLRSEHDRAITTYRQQTTLLSSELQETRADHIEHMSMLRSRQYLLLDERMQAQAEGHQQAILRHENTLAAARKEHQMALEQISLEEFHSRNQLEIEVSQRYNAELLQVERRSGQEHRALESQFTAVRGELAVAESRAAAERDSVSKLDSMGRDLRLALHEAQARNEELVAKELRTTQRLLDEENVVHRFKLEIQQGQSDHDLTLSTMRDRLQASLAAAEQKISMMQQTSTSQLEEERARSRREIQKLEALWECRIANSEAAELGKAQLALANQQAERDDIERGWHICEQELRDGVAELEARASTLASELMVKVDEVAGLQNALEAAQSAGERAVSAAAESVHIDLQQSRAALRDEESSTWRLGQRCADLEVELQRALGDTRSWQQAEAAVEETSESRVRALQEQLRSAEDGCRRQNQEIDALRVRGTALEAQERQAQKSASERTAELLSELHASDEAWKAKTIALGRDLEESRLQLGSSVSVAATVSQLRHDLVCEGQVMEELQSEVLGMRASEQAADESRVSLINDCDQLRVELREAAHDVSSEAAAVAAALRDQIAFREECSSEQRRADSAAKGAEILRLEMVQFEARESQLRSEFTRDRHWKEEALNAEAELRESIAEVSELHQRLRHAEDTRRSVAAAQPREVEAEELLVHARQRERSLEDQLYLEGSAARDLQLVVSTTRDELADARSKQADSIATCEAAEYRLEQAEADLEALRGAHAELVEQHSRNVVSLSRADAHAESLRSSCVQEVGYWEQIVEEWKEEHAVSEEHIQRLMEDHQSHSASHVSAAKRLRFEVEEMRVEMQDSVSQQRALRAELQRERGLRQDSEDSRVVAANKVAHLQSENKQLRERNAELEAAVEEDEESESSEQIPSGAGLSVETDMDNALVAFFVEHPDLKPQRFEKAPNKKDAYICQMPGGQEHVVSLLLKNSRLIVHTGGGYMSLAEWIRTHLLHGAGMSHPVVKDAELAGARSKPGTTSRASARYSYLGGRKPR